MLFITRYDGFLYQGNIARQQLLVKAIRDRKPYRTLREFYPFYLSEHTNQVSRRLHFVGTTTALILLVNALITQLWWLILIAFVQRYAFAWVGHFFYEYNRPATFSISCSAFSATGICGGKCLPAKFGFKDGVLGSLATLSKAGLADSTTLVKLAIKGISTILGECLLS